MDKVRCKVILQEKHEIRYSPQSDLTYRLKFMPVTGNVGEDLRFFKATPSGTIDLQVVNKAAADQFVAGQSYYMDFTPAE